MSPVNIQRDGIWTNPKTTADISWSTATAISTSPPLMNGDAVTYTDKAQAQAVHSVATVNAGTGSAIGVLMDPPQGENWPYRVQASCRYEASILIGYAPATPDGNDDIIEDEYYIPFERNFDGLIFVPALSSGDTYFGRALAIGVEVQPKSNVAALPILAHISVQNLGLKPPTMQYAVS